MFGGQRWWVSLAQTESASDPLLPISPEFNSSGFMMVNRCDETGNSGCAISSEHIILIKIHELGTRLA
jgi:hypothetical protein